MSKNTSQDPVPAPLVVGDSAPRVKVKDHLGAEIAFASLWQARPRVLLFVRHFG